MTELLHLCRKSGDWLVGLIINLYSEKARKVSNAFERRVNSEQTEKFQDISLT